MTNIFVSENVSGNVADNNASIKYLISKLTRRELDVLNLLAKGLSNKEIATELYLSAGTIRIYLSTIYGKLGVSSRTQAAIMAKDFGM